MNTTPLYTALAALLVSIFITTQTTMDARTQAFALAAVFILAGLMLKLSALWMFIYAALSVITALVVVYWVRLGILRFAAGGPGQSALLSPTFPVPIWLPVFFAVGYMSVHVLYGSLGGVFESDD